MRDAEVEPSPAALGSIAETPATGGSGADTVGTLLEDVFATLGIGVVVFDRALAVTASNRAAGTLLPMGTDITRTLEAAAFENRLADWPAALREVLQTGRPRQFDALCSLVDATRPRYFKLVIAPLGGANAEGGLLTVEEVTARIGVEQRLAVSERLAALGQLAARVAHELNNPLDGILRFVSLARRTAEETGAGKSVEYLDQARGGLLRMAEILRSLLEYSRGGPSGPRETTLAGLIEEAVRSFEKQASGSAVSVVCSFHQERLRVGGAGGLFQVFCNLIKNAIDAMPSGGTLTIKTRENGGELEISFEDTGVGLPAESDRLFEPFFTTKPAGQGTGLGLAVCREIVEKCSGRITAGAGARGGALFTIWLPRGEQGAES